MKVLGHLVAVILTLVAVLASVGPTSGQSSKPARDPAGIQQKVQRSAELQRQALQALGDRAQADRLIGNAYNQLKAAQDDMIMNASNARAPDPMLNLSIKKADQALSLVQGAGDAFKSGADNAADLARDRLQQALRVTNTLLTTGF